MCTSRGGRYDSFNVLRAVRDTIPFDAGVAAVSRVLPIVRASELPLLSRRAFSLELTATAFLMLAMATIEGGVIAVFAKQSFGDSVPSGLLNLMVGLIGATGELANILSFFWSGFAHGRRKIRLIAGMQAAMMLCVGCIALVPTTGAAWLWVLLGLVLVARVCWSGVLTLRPTVWRANYLPQDRTRIVGVLSGVQVLLVAVIGATLAWSLDRNPSAYRLFLPITAALGMVGVWAYSRIRLRNEAKLLREEDSDGVAKVMKPWHGPLVVLRVLREDKWYAQFMAWMFVLGFSNLTVVPMLVVSLREEYHLSYFPSVLVASSIPSLMTLLALPVWRRFLDRSHVVKFRSVHSWVFVFAGVFFTTGAAVDRFIGERAIWFYFLGAAMMGIGYGGGQIAWHLGHVDFARPSETSRYMATHVTLNGVRGLLAPIAVTSGYEALKRAGVDAHLWVQASSLMIGIVGAAGFVWLRWKMGKVVEARK